MVSSSRRLVATLAALVLPLGLGFCKGATESSIATTIQITPASALITSIGGTQQYTATVKDQNGHVFTSPQVSWSSSAPAVVTIDSALGLATAVANGSAYIRATSSPVTDSVAVTVTQAAAEVVKVAGDAQTGAVGTQLATSLGVQVRDAGGHPIAGAAVAFTTTSGGSLGTPSATTDATGGAASTWTLGTTAGQQLATATVGSASATFTATATSTGAASVAKQSGDGQSASAGTSVSVPPAVLVKDGYDNPVANVAVTFSVGSGGGLVNGENATTDGNGVATVGSWTLGAAGSNTLVATVSGSGIAGNPVTFSATATAPGAAANVAADTGNGQAGLVGYALNIRPAVKVTDASGNPVSGTSVTFAVTGGGGSVTGATVTSNVFGIAQVGSWVLGAAAGSNSLSATAAGLNGSPVSFAATGQVGTYKIGLLNIGPALAAPVQAALDSAVAKWQRIIYKALPPTNMTIPAGQACGDAGAPAIDTTSITGLIILVKFDSIDGAGNILGQAGPCGIRSGTDLSVLGEMEFDTADVATMISNGSLNSVMLHEMGHVIGFGTLWNFATTCLVDQSSPPTTILDTYFSCANARIEFDSIGGVNYTGAGLNPPGGKKVPVENCGSGVPSGCGAGTVNAHWREPVFGNELMTGYIQSGSNPLSVVTVGSLADQGYTVNYAGADTYTHSFSLMAPGGEAPPVTIMGDDILHRPIVIYDWTGRVVGVRRAP